MADALLRIEAELLVPDFWIGEATNVLWLQVRGKLLTPGQARESLRLLPGAVEPTSTAGLNLHGIALEIGIEVKHSTYDALYRAFAIGAGATGVVVSDGPFVRDMKRHPDMRLSSMLIPLDVWARSRDVAE